MRKKQDINNAIIINKNTIIISKKVVKYLEIILDNKLN